MRACISVAVALVLVLHAAHVRPARAYVLQSPLKGVELRCCAIIEPPIVQHDNSTVEHYNGIAIEYLRLLELKLGFRCSSLDDYLDLQGNNMTFNAAVDDLHRCSVDGAVRPDDESCRCDVGIGGWSLTEERIGKVDFVEPFAFDYYRVITHTNNTGHPVGTVFFFSAFETSVWVAVAVLVAVLGFLKLLDAHLAPRANEQCTRSTLPEDSPFARRVSHGVEKLEPVQRLKVAFDTMGTYVLGLSEQKARCRKGSMRRGLLNVVIFLCGIFLALNYQASMTNALLNEKRVSKLKGLEYFKDCKIPADEVCITAGSGAETFWNNAVATHNCHYRKDAPRAVVKTTFDEALSAFFKYECKYMIGLGFELQEIALGAHCNEVRLTGRPFHDTGVSFILPQDSNLTNTFSNATLELRDTDVLTSPQTFLSHEGTCEHKDHFSITLVKIVWFVLIICLLCGLVLLLIACATWREMPQERADVF